MASVKGGEYMTELTRRAEELQKAYEAIIEANAKIMAMCHEECDRCPIFKICDSSWIIYDDNEFKQVEPWADFVDRHDRYEEKEWQKSFEDVGIKTYCGHYEDRTDPDR